MIDQLAGHVCATRTPLKDVLFDDEAEGCVGPVTKKLLPFLAGHQLSLHLGVGQGRDPLPEQRPRVRLRLQQTRHEPRLVRVQADRLLFEAGPAAEPGGQAGLAVDVLRRLADRAGVARAASARSTNTPSGIRRPNSMDSTVCLE